jgi:histidinol-phosphate aminotransferase
MFDIEKLLRENIKHLAPYSTAREEFNGRPRIALDANENSYGAPIEGNYNRYPDPAQWELKKKISSVKGLLPENIFLGNGSDEAIDLLIRAFCKPGTDNIMIMPPTYGMYEFCAGVHDVEVRKVPLTAGFQLDLEDISETVDEHTKLIFLCSPNNPTGNSLNREDVEIVLNNFDGIVVVDEAYVNYSRQKSFIPELTEYPNLVVLQSFSHAWGLAGLRVGMAFASGPIIAVLNGIKLPHNISGAAQELVARALGEVQQVNANIQETAKERQRLAAELAAVPCVKTVFPSDANFLLVKVTNAEAVHAYLAQKGIAVRDRSSFHNCENCLRITIGTQEENSTLVTELKSFNNG